MVGIETMKTSALILSLGLLFTGCQTAQSLEKQPGLDNVGFMSLWDTYKLCQNGVDLDAMQKAVRHLNRIAHQPVAEPASDIPLPRAIQRYVADPPSRLAVDPKSMAAACTIYTGQVALTAGHNDVADEMFRTVLKQPGNTSPYYIEQARAGLMQANTLLNSSRSL